MPDSAEAVLAELTLWADRAAKWANLRVDYDKATPDELVRLMALADPMGTDDFEADPLVMRLRRDTGVRP